MAFSSTQSFDQTMKVSGGCYCGNVRYEAEGEPIMRALCHCRECQYLTGGGANVAMAMPAAEFSYTSGEPKVFARDDIEAPIPREFCADCGTSLLARPPGLADMVILKVGTMDDPAQYEGPEMAFYCSERQSFHYLPDNLTKFDRFPE